MTFCADGLRRLRRRRWRWPPMEDIWDEGSCKKSRFSGHLVDSGARSRPLRSMIGSWLSVRLIAPRFYQRMPLFRRAGKRWRPVDDPGGDKDAALPPAAPDGQWAG